MKLLQSRFFGKTGLSLLALGAALLTTVSNAQTVTLTDGSTTALVDVNSDMGMRQWTVRGVNQLNQQWFWYRIGNTVPAPINSISTAIYQQDADNLLTTRYENADFFVEINYVLQAGGFGQADILESITIHNKTLSMLNDFHFYQYSDFNLLNTPGGDTVLMDQTSAYQYKGASQIAEGIIDPLASYFEANTTGGTGSTLYKLRHEAGLNLAGAPPQSSEASGDVTWAFQWGFSIGANSDASIFKDKLLDIRVVPEPSTLALLGLGWAAFAWRRRTQA